MEDTNALEWQLLSEEHIINDEWIDFRRSSWKFPDGSIYEPYYSYSRKDYVVIAATDTDGNYICVKQFRQGTREITTEFCAGGIEKGEEPLKAAIRELQEETGYVSDNWTMLSKLPSNATIADNYAHIFCATECRKEAKRHLDPMEFIDVVIMKPEELAKLIDKDGFKQAVHVVAYYKALQYKNGAV